MHNVLQKIDHQHSVDGGGWQTSVSNNNNNSRLDNATVDGNIKLEGDNVSSKFVPKYGDPNLVQPRYPHVTHSSNGAYLGKMYITNYTLTH